MNPHEKAEKREVLAAEYARMSEELSDIEELKAHVWPEMREKASSAKETDLLWLQTANGKKENRLKHQMKANIHQQNALSSSLKVAADEARGLY